MRCTENLRQLELVGGKIDGDDVARAGSARAEHGGEADATEPYHRDGCAGAYLRGVDHRADAGQDGAAEERRLVEGQIRIDLDQRAA